MLDCMCQQANPIFQTFYGGLRKQYRFPVKIPYLVSVFYARCVCQLAIPVFCGIFMASCASAGKINLLWCALWLAVCVQRQNKSSVIYFMVSCVCLTGKNQSSVVCFRVGCVKQNRQNKSSMVCFRVGCVTGKNKSVVRLAVCVNRQMQWSSTREH